jgi:phosphoglycolate phosphatase-like HAD superfamily hydrolase
MGGAPDDPPKEDPPKEDPPKPDPPKEDEGEKGFPDNTPVAEMTDKQAAAYWKFQSRKHEKTAKDRGDYDDLKKRAAEADKLRKERETENEKALREAREAASAEGAELAAGQRLVGLLVARGKTEDEADEILEDLNLARYVKDGRPDRDAIAKAVERLAPPAKEGDKRKFPDLGQGRRDSATGGKGSAGAAEADRRFAKAGTKTATQ